MDGECGELTGKTESKTDSRKTRDCGVRPVLCESTVQRADSHRTH